MKSTKFILHGGFDPKAEMQVSDGFFHEMLVGTPPEVKVLIVYFATDKGDKYFPQDVEQFNKNSNGRKLIFERATEEDFEKQILNADVIYLHGGSSMKLLDAMKKFTHIATLIQGKIVGGDSAGANYLSTVFYSKNNGVCEGLGILPIKIIPHFVEENRNKLSQIRPELNTLFLPELHYEVISESK